MGLRSAITKYLFINGRPEKADAILIPGCPFPEPAELAARLYREGFAPVLVASGSRWIFHTGRRGGKAECDRMAEAAVEAGVPESAILRERAARHTLDNARLSKLLLDGSGIPVKTALICCQSFHARRCLKAYGRHFKGVRIIICPAETRGIDETSWWKTPLGIFKIATELLKCTGLFFCLISLARARPAP
jgi:uncharacterized SAM-binding protein YcdF (DUF218 family)